MPAVQSKGEIVHLVQSLPEGTSLDDVIERFILIRKVNMGFAQEGHGVPQPKAKAEFRKPRQKRSWNCE